MNSNKMLHKKVSVAQSKKHENANLKNDFDSLFYKKFNINLNHEKVSDSQSKKDDEIAQHKFSHMEKSVHYSNVVEYDMKNDNISIDETLQSKDLTRFELPYNKIKDELTFNQDSSYLDKFHSENTFGKIILINKTKVELNKIEEKLESKCLSRFAKKMHPDHYKFK